MIATLNKLFDTAMFLIVAMLTVLLMHMAIAILMAAILFLFEAHSVIALYTEDITSFSIDTIFQYYLYHSMAMSVYVMSGFIIGYLISILYDKYKEFKCTKNLI